MPDIQLLMTPPSIPDYTFRSLIGEGSSGRVYAAEYGGQALMALKAFDSESINRQLISDALVKIFNRDEHPGIVAVHDFDLASPQAYMATSLHGEPYQNSNGEEAFRPRTIQGLMGHLMPEDAWGYAREIAEALAFLHRQRVIHCNLKPSNVLLDGSTPPRIKLTDFSQGLVGSVPKLIPGDSVFYAPPEQIRQPEHYFGGRGERWDVYAFGVLTFQLLTGAFPRLGSAISEIKKHEAASLDVHFSYDFKVLADMIEDQEEYEWPDPAADDDESARRAIIDRCLRLKPEERYPDLREVLLAFKGLEDERERQEEHRKFAAEQLRSDKQAGSLKKISALLGVLALGGLAGAAYFSMNPGSGDSPPENADEPAAKAIAEPVEQPSGIGEAEFKEMEILLANSNENLRESHAALDEIFSLVIARDTEGNPDYELPEVSRGLLLNYYEEFSSQHKANPQLAREVARAENNAGEIHLSLGDSEAALKHLTTANEKISALRERHLDDVRLTIAAAQFSSNLSDAQALAGLDKAAADSTVASLRLWEQLYEANPTSAGATRALVTSLLLLGQRMLEIGRPADTGLHVQRAKTILKGLEAENEVGEQELVDLARCDYLIGMSERANGNLSDAITLLVEAVDQLLEVKIANRETPRSQLFLLAKFYGELADALAENGNRENSSVANEEGVKLLIELVDDSPSSTPYHFELARRFSTSAALLRDAGKGKEARAEQEKAVEILEDILKVHPERKDIEYELALALGDLTDLYADAKMKAELFESGLQSVKKMSDLLKQDVDPENNNSKRPRYRLAYGDLLVRFAQHTEKFFDDKERTLEYYTKGVDKLQEAVDAGIGSEEDLKLIEAAKTRIKALGGE